MSKASEKPLFSGRELKTLGKPEAVCERIRAMAQRVGAGARLPGTAQFCRELGISPNTLSKALAALELEGVVERRNGVGVFVAGGVAKRLTQIALVCRLSFLRTPGHSPIWDALVAMLSERAQQMGFEFDCSFAQDDDKSGESGRDLLLSSSLRSGIESGEIGGVLGIALPEPAAHWMVGHGVPVVNLYGYGNVVVKTDAADQVSLCVQALAERGCKRIGLWMGVHSLESQLVLLEQQSELRQAFDAELAHNNLKGYEELIETGARWMKSGSVSLPFLAEQGFETAKRIFSGPRSGWPDGLVIADDNMAHGALVALRQLGLQPGQDVQIAAGANAGSPLRLDADNVILAEVSVVEIVDVMLDRLQQLLSAVPDEQEVITIPARLRKTS